MIKRFANSQIVLHTSDVHKSFQISIMESRKISSTVLSINDLCQLTSRNYPLIPV